MALQAFSVGEDFADTNYRVAPLIQPDYAALRHTENGRVKHDLLEQINISETRLQAKHNSRFVDLATGQPLKERVGIYLSWTLPRMYRSGIVATESAAADHRDEKVRAGYDADSSGAVGSDYVQVR
jgi:hypothetical protein